VTTFAIIGHGPSPEGRGWGRKIDRCDHVVRMFNCGWQATEDYGCRYDAGVLTADARTIAWLHERPVRKPESWWIYSPGGSVFTVKGDAPCELITMAEHGPRGVVGAEMVDGKFAYTRGTAAVLHAIGKRPDMVVLVGMDDVAGGLFGRVAYPEACRSEMSLKPDLFAGEPRPTGETRSECHDLSIERQMIYHTAREFDVRVVTAQEVW